MKEAPSPSLLDDTKPKKSRAKLVIILLTVLVVVGGGVAGWLGWQNNQQEARFRQERTGLQARIDELTRNTQNTPTTPGDTKECCDGTIPQATKDAIRDAINSRNFAPLESKMASSVRFVLAASEYGPTVTPAQAVVDLGRLSDATTPWDFSLSTATLEAFDTGEYGDYFETRSFVARSADGMVVSFNFDNCGKINGIFVAVAL